ncbi:hypothetical protein D4764_14G0004280 [Takifugu flavidus]|uniref:Uncharacterized protein n=1 Tax=Takifugu flavidus TaxID=433684 RepID=A0A5C6P4Y8_9TELE|nr:hypothetical protein D4764_14G0004280 [Takifugu flavidus]
MQGFRGWGTAEWLLRRCEEMLLLLLSYFDEKEESMFFHVDDTCLAEEVELGQVASDTHYYCLWPVLLFFNKVHAESGSEPCQHKLSSFISALWLMFGSYYCFNIHYPSELASTLEFLQRSPCRLLDLRTFTVLRTAQGPRPCREDTKDTKAVLLDCRNLRSPILHIHRSSRRHGDLEQAGKIAW